MSSKILLGMTAFSSKVQGIPLLRSKASLMSDIIWDSSIIGRVHNFHFLIVVSLQTRPLSQTIQELPSSVRGIRKR
jgi:hypothetical protein